MVAIKAVALRGIVQVLTLWKDFALPGDFYHVTHHNCPKIHKA